MTRGKIFFVSDELIYSSIEFNGDMMPDSLGEFAIDCLQKANDWKSFVEQLKWFDNKFFHYNENVNGGIYRSRPLSDNSFNFAEDYFKNFGSDYLYIKNNGSKTLKIIDANDTYHFVQPQEIVCYQFGKVCDIEQYLKGN